MITNTYLAIPDDERPRNNFGQSGITPRCLLSVLHNGGTLPGSTSYTVDAAGNRTSKTALQQAAPTPVSVTSNFSYDNIYQLTQAVVGGSVAESYSFDAVGNRLTSAGPTSYTYNSSNQLTATSSATYAYDSNGNTTSKTDTGGTTNYTWDFENRLTQVTLPGQGGTVYFNYDPMGRRIRKVFGSATTIYAYDGDNITEELDSGGNLVAHYTQGAGIDEPLALTGSGGTYFYHADGLGSIISLTNGTGQFAASYVYDSFGKLNTSTGTVTNPFRYTGREFDAVTGLYYYRARYYDPASGRFSGEDPIGFKGGINFYRYVHNLPTTSRDPFGYQKCDAGLPENPDAALLAHLIAGEATWRKNNRSEMAAIAYTVVNRLNYLQANPKTRPSFFGGTSASIAGLITPGQYGSVGSDMYNLPDNISSIDTSCSKGQAVCDFLKNAIDIADGVIAGNIDDPFADYGGTFAMRTKGHGGPGGLFTDIPAKAQIDGSNNVFFGLKQ